MLRTSVFAMLVVFLLELNWINDASANGTPADEALMVVLEQAKAGDFPKVLDAIDALDKQGPQADSSLVALLDYYAGEGPSTLVSEAITRRGKRMLMSLNAKRKSDLQCLPQYSSICMNKFADGRQQRNSLIDRLADAIRKGKILRAGQ